MSETRAKDILKRQQALAGARSNFETIWQQIAERMLPGSANFTSKRTPGTERTERMFDATGALAVRKYATILESATIPRNQEYHGLTADFDGGEPSQDVKAYFEDVNKRLFKARYAASSNFTGQSGSALLELAAFGNASMFVDDEPGFGLRYRAIPLAESYFSENHVGMVDTHYRKFEYTARQAVLKWGDRCPEKIKQAATQDPDSMWCFVHVVQPNDGSREDGLLKDHAWQSITVSEVGEAVVQVGGYYTWPYPIMRDLTSAGEVYGRSPGVWVLPDVKMLNEMNRTVLRAGHKAVDPPVLLQEDGALTQFDLRPGALNFGGVSQDGSPLAIPFQNGARIDMGLELMQMKQQIINEAHFITLFQILVDNPKMTATEVMERAQEKGMFLGPLAGRQQSEFLGPLIERELDILARKNQLPEMPEELAEAGGKYKVVYKSPLARAQRAEEGVAILRTIESMIPLAEARPDILDNVDWDATIRALGEINGMAAKLFTPMEAMQGIRDQRAQQQQAMQMAEAAPGVAGAVKDLSEAGAAA